MSRGPWSEDAMRSKRSEGERIALIISALEELPVEERQKIDRMADQLVVAMHAIRPKMQFSRLMAIETLWSVGRELSKRKAIEDYSKSMKDCTYIPTSWRSEQTIPVFIGRKKYEK